MYTALFSAMGYGSVVFVLLLIKTTGATEAEIVKSCRKASVPEVSQPIVACSRACDWALAGVLHRHVLCVVREADHAFALGGWWCLRRIGGHHHMARVKQAKQTRGAQIV